MANGKALQKMKDELNKDGCEQGRMRQTMMDNYVAHVNGIGKRMNWIMFTLVSMLVALITNLIIMLLK
jgi:hypothetical protein